jgi:type IV secretory pathway VirB3-like protein
MRRMRTRTFTILLLALAVGPGLLFYGLTRTALYGAIVKALGANTVLVIAIVLLALLIGAAIFAVAYGFAKDEDQSPRRRPRERGGS